MLSVENLSVSFRRYRGLLERDRTTPLRDVSLSVARGELLGVIGASGAGKSLLAHAVMGLLPGNAEIGGAIGFEGERLTPERAAALRGRRMALVPQSIAFLDPLARIGRQVAWAARRAGASRHEAAIRADNILARLGLDARAFPHALSGGMARRALIAAAIAGDADLILADEPTVGLDPVEAGAALARLRALASAGKAVLVISHDLAALAATACRIAVLRDGRTIETAPAAAFAGDGEALRTDDARALWRALPQNAFAARETLAA